MPKPTPKPTPAASFQPTLDQVREVVTRMRELEPYKEPETPKTLLVAALEAELPILRNDKNYTDERVAEWVARELAIPGTDAYEIVRTVSYRLRGKTRRINASGKSETSTDGSADKAQDETSEAADEASSGNGSITERVTEERLVQEVGTISDRALEGLGQNHAKNGATAPGMSGDINSRRMPGLDTSPTQDKAQKVKSGSENQLPLG